MSDYEDLENSDEDDGGFFPPFTPAASSDGDFDSPREVSFVESGGLEALPLELHRLIMRYVRSF